MKRSLVVRRVAAATIVAGVMVGMPATGPANAATVAAPSVAAADSEVPGRDTSEQDKVDAFSVLGLGDPGPELVIMNDRDFVNEIWKRSKGKGEVHATAELALMANDQAGYVAFIQGGIHAAQARQIANDLVAEAELRAARSLRRNAAAAAKITVDDSMLLLPVQDFIVKILTKAEGARVRAAAVTALGGDAAAQHEFLATGVSAAAAQDLQDLLDKIAKDDIAAHEHAKRMAAMRSAAAVLGIVASDGMLALSDQNFVVAIWNAATEGTEVHAAAVKAARKIDDPAAWRAFIDTGIHEANRDDIRIALDKKTAADRRLAQQVLADAEKSGWQNMIAAARAALAAGPDAVADFLRVGRHQVLPDLIQVEQLVLGGNRIGVLTTDGVANVKDGGLSAAWVKQYQRVKQVVLAGDRIGVLTEDGTALVKEGGLSAFWTTQYTGVKQLVLDGDRIGVLTTAGAALVKEGGLKAAWTTEHTGIKQLVLAGDRIGVLTEAGAARVKEGSLKAAWTDQFPGVKQLVLAGDRIGVLTTAGSANVKEGGLKAGWVTQFPGVEQLVLAGDRIGVLTADGTARVKEGGLRTGWVVQHPGVQQLALAGKRIGVVTSGTAKVKEGGLSASWVTVQGVVQPVPAN